MSGVSLILYLSNNRLRRVAFLRKEYLINKTIILYNMIFNKLIMIIDTRHEIQKLQKELSKLNETKLYQLFKTIMFIIIATLITIIFIFFAVIYSFYITFFKALIIWRGFQNIINFSFLIAINNFLTPYGFWIKYLFYPFLFVADKLSNITVNLSAVNVTCSGAQVSYLL